MRTILLTVTVVSIAVCCHLLSGAAETKPARSGPGAPKNAVSKPGAEEAPKNGGAAAAAPAGKKTETAIFAGGCFWCTEFAFEQLAGVTDVESGYCGGSKATANYNQVHLGTTGHAEAIRVTYDPDKVTYDKLLDVFFDSHDPTQLNRQGEDEGRQYRSAIFFMNEDQQKQAKAKIESLDSKRVFKRRIATKLEPLKEFYPAEEYHQDFARRNTFLPYIQGHAIPKAAAVRSKHPDLIQNGN